MQQYAGIYLLQNHSLHVSAVHRTHHQKNMTLQLQPLVQVLVSEQDATVCRYLFTAKSLSTCFGCPSHPSSEEHDTLTAASGTGYSI